MNEEGRCNSGTWPSWQGHDPTFSLTALPQPGTSHPFPTCRANFTHLQDSAAVTSLRLLSRRGKCEKLGVAPTHAVRGAASVTPLRAGATSGLRPPQRSTRRYVVGMSEDGWDAWDAQKPNRTERLCDYRCPQEGEEPRGLPRPQMLPALKRVVSCHHVTLPQLTQFCQWVSVQCFLSFILFLSPNKVTMSIPIYTLGFI